MAQENRTDDARRDEIKEFINASTAYRAEDKIKQEYLIAKVEAIEAQCRLTNGRVTDLEEVKKAWDVKTQYTKDLSLNRQNFFNIVLGVIMAISAIIIAIPPIMAMFKK